MCQATSVTVCLQPWFESSVLSRSWNDLFSSPEYTLHQNILPSQKALLLQSKSLKAEYGSLWPTMVGFQYRKEEKGKSTWNSKFWGNSEGGWIIATDFDMEPEHLGGHTWIAFPLTPCVWCISEGYTCACACEMVLEKTGWYLELEPFSHGVLIQEREDRVSWKIFLKHDFILT